MPRIDPAKLDMLRSKAAAATKEYQEAQREMKAAEEKWQGKREAMETAKREMYEYLDEFIKVPDIYGR